MATKNPRLQVVLEKPLYHAVAFMAKSEKVSLSLKARDLIREAIEQKAYKAIDPAQLYFWTRQWQKCESEAESDKKAGRVIGDGTVRGLLKALKHR